MSEPLSKPLSEPLSDRAFGAAALGLSGLAAQLLGWRPDHFWLATPAELGAALAPLMERGGSIDRSLLNTLMEHDDASRK